jgi:hypothetical protein
LNEYRNTRGSSRGALKMLQSVLPTLGRNFRPVGRKVGCKKNLDPSYV